MAQSSSMSIAEVIGIVIGAIVLFGVISIVPIIMMWFQRQRAAKRSAREIHNITSSMEQVSVGRWLAEQNTASETHKYAQDTCPICLSHLSSTAYLQLPEPAHQSNPRLYPSTSASTPEQGNCIIILNRCHHVFHLNCITSWFEYRHYKCPLCQASYSPVNTANTV